MTEAITGVYPNVIVARINDAGRTLVAHEDDIAAGEEILRVLGPLAALDSGHLQDACSNCYLWISGNNHGSQDGDPGPQKVELKACLGCKVVKYCSKVREFLALE